MVKVRKTKTTYGVIKQQLYGLTNEQKEYLLKLCRISKNIYNEALYNIRQYFFEHKKKLSYFDNRKKLQVSENYKSIPARAAMGAIMMAHANFDAFLSNLRNYKKGKIKNKPKMPRYLEKDGFFPIFLDLITIKNQEFKLPKSIRTNNEHVDITIKVPKKVEGLKVKQIVIQPILGNTEFEVSYVYETEPVQKTDYDYSKALGIDLGISNLATCADTNGNAFIIDGKRLKSIIQWYNKEFARLKSVYDLQKLQHKPKKYIKMMENRKRIIRDYLHKAATMIINYCIDNKIGNIVVGKNNIHDAPNLGRQNNQNISNMPLGYFRDIIKDKAEKNGIKFIEVDEAYTSKASALDKDPLPPTKTNEEVFFSGKRICRGLYKTKDGKVINSDVNGSLNILRKGGFDYNISKIPTPKRYKVFKKGLCKI